MVFAKIKSDGEINNNEVTKVNEILKEVFIKEKGYNEDLIFKQYEGKRYHVLLYEAVTEEELIAYGSLIINGNSADIVLLAVKESYRGKKYGDLITRMLIDKALSSSYNNIYVDLPNYLISMFKKIGFYKIEDSEDREENVNKPLIYDIRLKYDINRPISCKKV